jgi:ketosteroid isomerase-like protein
MTCEDELAIRNLLARVAHITDGRGSLEEYLTYWTEDATWESPVAGSFRGHAGQLERHERYRAAGVQGPDADSFHLLTTVYVHVDGDEATSMSSWLYVGNTASAPKIEDVGTYTDSLRRTPEGWKLSSRKVTQGSGDWLRRREAEQAEKGA